MPPRLEQRWARLTAPYLVASPAPDLPNAQVYTPGAPPAHAASHAPGGSDPVTGLDNTSIAAAAGIVETKLALNFATHTNANDPSAGEKSALAGTSGTPGAGNKYVTDADARNTNARAPTAHKASHVAGGSDPFASGDLLDATARVRVESNGVVVNSRRGINFGDSAGLSWAVTDSPPDERVDLSLGLDAAVFESGQALALSGIIDSNARVAVRKNSGAVVGTRRRLNLIEGTNVTLTVADDAGNEEVDVTIAAAGGSGSATATTVTVSSPALEASVTVVDAAVSPTSKIVLGWGNCAQSDANHPGMGQVSFNAVPGTGQFTVEIYSLDGSVVFGAFKLLYQVL